MSPVALVLFLVVLTMACSGGSPTLQLRTGPISEDAFRVQVRQSAFLQPSTFQVVCSIGLTGNTATLSTADILDAFQKINPFATVERPLEFHSADAARAVELLAEECESLT